MKASERRLLVILGLLAAVCGGAILSQRLLQMQRGIERREQTLELKRMEAAAMLAEGTLWQQRLDWLRTHQPGMTSENQASEQLLEEVLAATAAHRLVVQKKQLHEASRQASYQEVGVTLTILGELPDVFRWMHGLLAPESFQSVSRLKITPDATEKTKVSAIVRVNRLHAPVTAAAGVREGPGS
jgi:hypothetical protein